MKKILFLLSAITVISCQEEPKNYVTFSGKITNKSSDSVVLRTRDYSKTIKVNKDGTFSDTLKVETGIYNFFDGNESANVFLKNGYDINLTLDTKEFDETLTYTGTGAEHSTFLVKKSLKQEELLNMDELGAIADMEALNASMDNVKTELNAFYASQSGIDSSLVNSSIRDIEPMLKFYTGYLADAISLKSEFPVGAPSPTFIDYENIDGTTTSLEDLNGKYTYIDIWATWCAPCKAEIPSLKALEKEYHGKDIQFVSLSIDDDRSHGGSWDKAREDWKTMIADENLGGIQLFAPEGWQTPFIKEYKINGIPRFILIDPNGNIVSPDAPRPSSEKLKELFNTLDI